MTGNSWSWVDRPWPTTQSSGCGCFSETNWDKFSYFIKEIINQKTSLSVY